MIEILTKITIIVVENREPYYFIIIYKYKEVFSYQMLASTFDSDERGLVTIRSTASQDRRGKSNNYAPNLALGIAGIKNILKN